MADEKKSRTQKLSEYLGISEKIINQLKIIIPGALAVWIFFAFFFGNSKTSVAFVSADANVIHIRVRNNGWKSSTLREYRLKFPDLPFDEAPLDLIEADAQKGHVPRRSFSFSDLTFDDGSVDLGLIASGLSSRVRGLTDPEIRSMLANGHATVEIVVQEAKDPPQGPWQERSDTVPATRMEFFIMKKIR